MSRNAEKGSSRNLASDIAASQKLAVEKNSRAPSSIPDLRWPLSDGELPEITSH